MIELRSIADVHNLLVAARMADGKTYYEVEVEGRDPAIFESRPEADEFALAMAGSVKQRRAPVASPKAKNVGAEISLPLVDSDGKPRLLRLPAGWTGVLRLDDHDQPVADPDPDG